MYKIYINDTPLYLVDAEDKADLPAPSDLLLVARYPGKAKILLNYADMLEKSNRYEAIYLYHQDLPGLLADFKGHYEEIEAAGGVVHSPESELLMIYRLQTWDLPKGKIEKNEEPTEAAVREVEEETGLQQITLGEALGITYHTYRKKSGIRVLKKTYWYLMQAPRQELTPQQEEDIERALWMFPEEALAQSPMYGNIRDLLNQAVAVLS